jgi:hypothetical protein
LFVSAHFHTENIIHNMYRMSLPNRVTIVLSLPLQLVFPV